MSSLHPFTGRTARILCVVSVLILAITVVAELFIHRHGLFGLDESFGFNAWYGFAACVGLVAVSRLIGFVLKRPDSYYDR
ncbi:MAG: hypothetical protein FJX55_18185 [Alphaproteobacteria bacterium]|nr:hypothetical protein [Alphaproteobacteria bacterium]